MGGVNSRRLPSGLVLWQRDRHDHSQHYEHRVKEKQLLRYALLITETQNAEDAVDTMLLKNVKEVHADTDRHTSRSHAPRSSCEDHRILSERASKSGTLHRTSLPQVVTHMRRSRRTRARRRQVGLPLKYHVSDPSRTVTKDVITRAGQLHPGENDDRERNVKLGMSVSCFVLRSWTSNLQCLAGMLCRLRLSKAYQTLKKYGNGPRDSWRCKRRAAQHREPPNRARHERGHSADWQNKRASTVLTAIFLVDHEDLSCKLHEMLVASGRK